LELLFLLCDNPDNSIKLMFNDSGNSFSVWSDCLLSFKALLLLICI